MLHRSTAILLSADNTAILGHLTVPAAQTGNEPSAEHTSNKTLKCLYIYIYTVIILILHAIPEHRL